MKTKLAVLLCAGLSAVLLAACGGGGGSGSGGGPALTKDEFIAKADAICAQGEQKFKSVQADIERKIKNDPTEIKAVITDSLTQITPILRETVNQIGDLTPPEELQSKLDEFVSKVNDAADQVEADPQKFAEQATSGDNPFADIDQLSTDLGLQDCGPGGG